MRSGYRLKTAYACITAACMYLAIAVPLSAQKNKPTVRVYKSGATTSCTDIKRSEGRGFFMVGAQGMDIGELNDRLKASGYGSFSDTFASFGGGGYGILGRLMLGVEGVAVLGGSKSGTIGGDYFKAALNGGYGLFRVGYVAYRRGGFIFYPSVGIGGGGLSLEISKEETVPFDSILKDPKRNARLGCGFALIDLGVGADHLVILDRKSSGDEGGFAFGVRAGYLFAPYRSDWGDAINGPDSAIEGAYIRFTLGGGGSQAKR